MSARCNYQTTAERGGQVECGRPAEWTKNELHYCDQHGRAVAVYIALDQIGGDAVLDLRPPQRNIRRYRYPRP